MSDDLRPTGKVLSQKEDDRLLLELSELANNIPDFSKLDNESVIKSFLQKEDRKRDEHRIREIRGRMKRVESINDSFALFISDSLSDFLFQDIQFNPISIDIELYKQYMRQIPVPIMMFRFECHPLNHPMFCFMDNRLVQLLIQMATGNKLIQHSTDKRRDYTIAERKLIEPIVHLIKNEITSAWTNAIADFRISRVEPILAPMYMEDAYADMPCAIITFEVEVEDEFLGCFQIAVPTTPLDSIMPILQSQSTMRLMSCMDMDFLKIIKERAEDKLKFLEKNIRTETPYQKLNEVDANNLSQLLSKESPYIIASILSFLKPEVASQILRSYPKEFQDEIQPKMKNIKICQPIFANILDEYFSNKSIPSSYSPKGNE